MRLATSILLLSFIIFACGGEEDFDGGSSGGSGDFVIVNFDCDSPDIDCPGAEKISNPLPVNGREVKCAWSCAINTTDFVEPGFEDLIEPARYIITFRKVGNKCWKVHDVDTDKCGKDFDEGHSMDIVTTK